MVISLSFESWCTLKLFLHNNNFEPIHVVKGSGTYCMVESPLQNYIRPVLLRQGEPGTPQYVTKSHCLGLFCQYQNNRCPRSLNINSNLSVHIASVSVRCLNLLLTSRLVVCWSDCLTLSTSSLPSSGFVCLGTQSSKSWIPCKLQNQIKLNTCFSKSKTIFTLD